MSFVGKLQMHLQFTCTINTHIELRICEFVFRRRTSSSQTLHIRTNADVHQSFGYLNLINKTRQFNICTARRNKHNKVLLYTYAFHSMLICNILKTGIYMPWWYNFVCNWHMRTHEHNRTIRAKHWQTPGTSRHFSAA